MNQNFLSAVSPAYKPTVGSKSIGSKGYGCLGLGMLLALGPGVLWGARRIRRGWCFGAGRKRRPYLLGHPLLFFISILFAVSTSAMEIINGLPGAEAGSPGHIIFAEVNVSGAVVAYPCVQVGQVYTCDGCLPGSFYWVCTNATGFQSNALTVVNATSMGGLPTELIDNGVYNFRVIVGNVAGVGPGVLFTESWSWVYVFIGGLSFGMSCGLLMVTVWMVRKGLKVTA